MKKFYFLLSFIVVSISCTSDPSDSVTVDPNLLQRVDFYPGTSYEKRWLFNEDGLLNEITKSDGTVTQTFAYDSNDRLSISIIYNTDGTSNTLTFTYDTDNFVTAINSESLSFNASTSTYTFGDTSSYYTTIIINSDKQLTYTENVWIDYDWDGTPIEITNSQTSVIYSSGNVLSYFPNESCNYFTYDDKINPLKNATQAMWIAFSPSGYLPWNDINCISANNVLTHDYCSEDPESSIFHYTYNSNNLPTEKTEDSYYLGVYESTRVAAKYYYQGDVIP